MNAVTISEAQATLPDLLKQLKPGEELEITDGGNTIAKLVSNKPRTFGLGKGKLIIHSDDNEHLADFQEYLP